GGVCGRRRALPSPPLQAVRLSRVGPVGSRRSGLRAEDGAVGARAPANRAPRVLQLEAGLEVRPRLEAEVARRLSRRDPAARRLARVAPDDRSASDDVAADSGSQLRVREARPETGSPAKLVDVEDVPVRRITLRGAGPR